MATTVPMLAPNGQSGDVPLDQVEKAKASGFKVAVQMQSPDGRMGYIPAERSQEAAQSGFKMVPTAVPDAQKQSYWEALTNPVGAGGRGQGVLGGALQVGGQAIKAAVQPVVHPLDTLSGMYNMVRHPQDTAAGIVQNFKNDQAAGGTPLAVENAAGQLLGSVEGGRVMAAAARPVLQGSVNAAGKAALLGKTPEAAYESALKPSTTKFSAAQRSDMVQTGLQQGIPVSKSGLETIGARIDALNDAIKQEIGKDPNRPISPTSSFQALRDTRARFQNQVTPAADMQAINSVGNEFADRFGPNGEFPQGTMPAANAQAMKSGTYTVLKGKYGEQGSATVEAQKALARGLKDEIAQQFPEISGLNAQESKLLALEPVLEQAVNRISNHQLIGIGSPIMGTAVKATTGSTSAGAIAMALKAVLDNPMVKSRLAIAVSKGGKIPFSQAAARIGAYSTALGASVGATPQAQGDQTGNQTP